MTRLEQPEEEGKKSVPELKEAIRQFLLKKEKSEEEIAKTIAERERAWEREPAFRLKKEHADEMEIIFWEKVLHDIRRTGIVPSNFKKDTFGSPQGPGFHQDEDLV